jgi:hypothetical protein
MAYRRPAALEHANEGVVFAGTVEERDAIDGAVHHVKYDPV